MVEIQIQKDFRKALGYFLRALRFHELHFIVEDISIPKIILRKRYLVPARIQDVKENGASIFLFFASFFVFLYYWIYFRKQINEVFVWLNEEKEVFINIGEKIPLFSGCLWKQNVIFLYPMIGGWAGSRRGTIYIGIKPEIFAKTHDVGVVIHELIHINTSMEAEKRTEHLISNWNIADELATVLLTRRLQRELLHVPENELQHLPVPFRDIHINGGIEKLEETARYASFASLLLHCSDALPKNDKGV